MTNGGFGSASGSLFCFVSPSFPCRHNTSRILYGLGWHPKMGGYAVGYAIVRRCLERGYSLAQLMTMEAKDIAELAGFSGEQGAS
nr:DUF2268 domain-containing putative Zn-dependent protease [Geobacillus sp. C56-T3]